MSFWFIFWNRVSNFFIEFVFPLKVFPFYWGFPFVLLISFQLDNFIVIFYGLLTILSAIVASVAQSPIRSAPWVTTTYVFCSFLPVDISGDIVVDVGDVNIIIIANLNKFFIIEFEWLDGQTDARTTKPFPIL